LGNTIYSNSIFSNDSRGIQGLPPILLQLGGNHGLEAPTLTLASPFDVTGTVPPGAIKLDFYFIDRADVGGYYDVGTALDERSRLQQLTGFEGWVVDAPDDREHPYRVVLGAYRSVERATGAANLLLRSKTLPNVTVVPLPPRSTRQ
jgi:hypothetical protein